MKQCRLFAAVVSIAIAALLAYMPIAVSAAEPSDRLILYYRLVPPDMSPERYFCTMVSELRDFNGSDYPPNGVMTDSIMVYGVKEVYRAQLIGQTNSRLQPNSLADGAYVLAIDPLFTVCARSYVAKKSPRGRPAIGYVDLRDGKSYDFVLRGGTTSFDVFKVEVAGDDVLKALWTDWKKSH